MTAYQGLFVVIKAGDGANPENFSTIGGLRITSLTLNQQALVRDDVESGPWRALSPASGQRSISLSGRGIFTNSASEVTVRSHAFSGSIGNYQLVFANGDIAQGPFLISSYVRLGEYEGEETYSLTLQSAGPVSFIAA